MNLFVLCVLSMVVLGQTSPLIRFKRASEQSASKSQRSPQARNKQITPITLKIIQNNALPTTLLSSRGNPASNHNSDPAPTRDPATAQKSSDQFMNQKLTDEQRILESTKQTTIQEPVDQSPSLECVNLEDTSSHCFVKDEDSKKDSSILIPVSFGEQCLVEAETDDIVKGEIPLICTCLDSTSNTGPLKIISDASPTETDPILCSCKRLTHDPFPATDVFIDSTKRIDDEKFSTNIEKSKSSDILMCSCQKSAIPNSCSINKIFDVKEASPMIENTAVTNPINLECSCKQVNSARDSLEIILEDSKNSLGTDDLNIPSSSSINKNVVIKEASLMTDSTAVANPINLECSCKRANLELEDSGGTSDLNTDCKDSEAALAIVRKSSPDKKIDRTFELTDDSKPSIDLVCSCRDLNSDPGLISNRKAGSFNIDESQSSVNVACSCKKSRENSGLVDSPGPISETLGQKSSESFSCTCQSSKLSSAGTSDPSTITVKAQGTNSECNEKLEDPSDFASCSCSQNQFNSKLSITCTHPANFCGKTNAVSGSITNLNVETCDSDATNKCAPESDRTFCRNCNSFNCDCGTSSCHDGNCNHQSSIPVDSALRDCNTPGEVKDSQINNFDGNAVICNDCDRTFCRNCNGFICDCGACSCHGCNCNHQSSTPVDSALRDCNTPGLEVKDSRVNNFDGNAVICNDCDRTFCRNCNGFICDCGACSCRGGNRHQQSSIPVDSTLRDCDTPRSAGDAQINNCYCDSQRPITIDPLQREGEGRDQLLSTGEELKIGGKGCSRQLSISFIPLIQQETDCDQKPKIDESTNIDGNCDRHQLSQPEEFFCRESTKCESNINGNNCCDQSKQIKSTTIDGNCDRSQSSQPGEYCCRESTQCESKIKNNKFCDQSERQEGNCDQKSVRSELNGNNSDCPLPQQCLLPIDQKIFEQKESCHQGSECTELETNNSGFCPYQLVSVHPPSSDPEMHRQQNSAPHFTSQNDGRISSDPDQSGAQTQASNATETRFSINDCSTKPPVIPSMCAFIMYPRMNVSNLDPTKSSSQLSSNPMLFTPFEFNKVDQIVCCN